MEQRDTSSAELRDPTEFDPDRLTFERKPSREEEIARLLEPVPDGERDDDDPTGLTPARLPAGSRTLAEIGTAPRPAGDTSDDPDDPRLSRAELALYRESLDDLIEAERAAGANQLQFD